MKRTTVITEMHLAVLLFGFAGLFGKFVQLPVMLIVFGRTLFAAVILGLVLLKDRQRLTVMDRRDIFGIAASGLLLALHWFSFFYSIQISTVAIGLLTFSTFPVFVTFLEPVFFKEKLRGADLITAALVVAGLGLIVPKFDFSHAVTRGVAWGVLSGLTHAFLSLLARHYVRKVNPLPVTFLQQSAAALASLPLAVILFTMPTLMDIGLLAVLGMLCTALAQLLYMRSLRSITAQAAAILMALEPVYGIVLAILLLGEIPGWRTVGGGLLILIAVIMVTLRKSRDGLS